MMNISLLPQQQLWEQREAVCKAIEDLIVRIVARLYAYEDPTVDLRLPPLCAPDNRGLKGGIFNGAKELSSLLQVLSTCYELLKKRKTATQRELYYMHANSFRDQKEAEVALARAMEILQVPRHSLGILASGRGWFAGCVQIRDASNSGIYTSVSVGPPRPIPADSVYMSMKLRPELTNDIAHPNMNGTSSRSRYRARFILVVEKDCIFRRLVEDRIWERPGMECVIVTGCGFPDIATRAFLYQLVRCFNDQHSSHRDDYEAVFGRLSHDSSHQEHPRIPVLGLSDCNPFGLAIMLCYALGSKSNSHANQFCVPSLQWLGLRNEDIDTFDLPKSAIQSMTRVDEMKTISLLKMRSVQCNPSLYEEVSSFLETREKMELEGILSRGIEFLTNTYLPVKLGLRYHPHMEGNFEQLPWPLCIDAIPLYSATDQAESMLDDQDLMQMFENLEELKGLE